MFLYRFCKRLYKQLSYQKTLNEVYKNDRIIEKMSYALGSQVRKDRIGRLYTVINPSVKDGKYNEDLIFEESPNGYSKAEYIKKWIMERMLIMEQFTQANGLFDVLSYDIEELESDNYLLAIFPVTLPPLFKSITPALLELFGMGLIIGGCLMIF